MPVVFAKVHGFARIARLDELYMVVGCCLIIGRGTKADQDLSSRSLLDDFDRIGDHVEEDLEVSDGIHQKPVDSKSVHRSVFLEGQVNAAGFQFSLEDSDGLLDNFLRSDAGRSDLYKARIQLTHLYDIVGDRLDAEIERSVCVKETLSTTT